MTLYAKVNPVTYKVTNIIEADENAILERSDSDFWFETSENIRYNRAMIGHYYDADGDAFYSPKPYNNWSLNRETFSWEPPITYPDDGNNYKWNEQENNWELVVQE